MGLNVGGIYVRVKRGITQERIAAVVEAHWTKLGGRASTRDPLSFDSLNLGKSGDLGFAITPPASGRGNATWIGIYDSERYSADAKLAGILARQLATEVWLYEITDTVNMAYAKRYGPQPRILRGYESVTDQVDGFPYAALYFNQLKSSPKKALRGFRFLAFEGIPHIAKTKYSGPSGAQLGANARVARAEQLLATRDLDGLVALARHREVYFDVVRKAVEYADPANLADRKLVRATAAVCAKNEDAYCTTLETALREDDEKLFARSLALMPKYRLYTLESRAQAIGATEPWIAFRLLEALTTTPGVELRTINSAVHYLEKVIGQERLPKKRVDALIARAFAAAPSNPYIFHNLACALLKRGDRDGALNCVEGAVRYGYEQLTQLASDDDLSALCKHPRYIAAFAPKTPASPGTLGHLAIMKGDKAYLVPTIGLHLYFEGPSARKSAAEWLGALHREQPEIFAHYLPRGHVSMEPVKKGRVERTRKALEGSQRYMDKVYFNAEPRGAASDRRVLMELDSDADGAGEISLHLPLAMADDPASLLERLLADASRLPFVVGQAGYSLAAYYEGNGCPAEEDLRRALKSHLGLTTSQACLHIVPDATFVTPNWVTLLGRAAVQRLGAKPIAHLAKKKLVRELAGGAVAIIAAPAPFVGLVTAPGDLGALPEIVRALAPLLPAKVGEYDYQTLEAERLATIATL